MGQPVVSLGTGIVGNRINGALTDGATTERVSRFIFVSVI